MSHSILPPSSASIWGAPNGCPGWVKMMANVPEEIRNARTPASIEGDAAHKLSEQMIDSAVRANIEKPIRGETVGSLIADAVVTDEMFDACELYANDVREVALKTRVVGGAFFGIEERFDIWKVHRECFGTPDMFIYDSVANTLYLWDFKFGHVYVDEYENRQAICYIAGIVARLVPKGFNDPKLKIVIRIVQPRVYGRGGAIREWRTSGPGVVKYVHELNEGAHIALSDEAVIHTGSHCRYCKARTICPEALKAGLSLYEMASAPTSQNMSLEAVGVQYAILERAKEQIDALENGFAEQITHLLKSGKSIPGHTLEPKMGRKRWNRPDSEVISMGALLGVELSNGKAITPNQAIARGVDENVVKSFSKTPSNGLKLVKTNSNLANRIFLNEEQELYD